MKGSSTRPTRGERPAALADNPPARAEGHLDNPFVIGLLEAYWEAYEAVELNTYADLHYWQEAWRYHELILNCLCDGDFDAARVAFVEHTKLLRHRNNAGREVSVARQTNG